MTSDSLPRSWEDLPREPPRRGDELRLERNGWQALLAYLSGPAWTYQVTASSEPVVVYSDTTGHSRPATVEEEQIRSEELRVFLEENSVPYPPEGIEWRLVLPAGTDGDSFWGRVNRSVVGLDPAQQRVREVVERELRTLLVSD
ncbi:DUF5956 family protein [Yonghaparkia sp. Root332]|uniref:DUF5956 family protein n=1 Tax=unclassified Microcella TaxID=2630066 RepID=UPI0035148B9C